METSAWCLMEAVSGQAGITVSNTIRITFLEPKCD